MLNTLLIQILIYGCCVASNLSCKYPLANQAHSIEQRIAVIHDCTLDSLKGKYTRVQGTAWRCLLGGLLCFRAHEVGLQWGGTVVRKAFTKSLWIHVEFSWSRFAYFINLGLQAFTYRAKNDLKKLLGFFLEEIGYGSLEVILREI